MFERFTTEAREVVVRAQAQARELGASQVEPAHLLLALCDGDGPAARILTADGIGATRVREALGGTGGALDAEALAALGIDLDSVREIVEGAFGRGALDAPAARGRLGGHLRFANGSKQTLQQALRAALRRGERRLDSRHVLLGVLAVGDGQVTEALRRLGVDPEVLRRHAEDQSDAA